MPPVKKIASFLARPLVPFCILPPLMILLIAGTVAQRYIGLHEAQHIFFGSIVAVILLGALFLSLTCKFLVFSPWNRKRAGINIAHLGILVLLAGGFLTAAGARESNLVITEGAENATLENGDILPFIVHLDDFHRENHPGTAMARAYRSDVTLKDGPVSWPVRIEMNEPLRYKGYTLFQSSFAENGEKEATVLAVVRNRAWLFPYFGTALMALGLLFHTVVSLAGKRQK